MAGVRQFCIGWRRDGLKKLINVYKFQMVRAVAPVLAELMNGVLAGADGVIVPLPTIQKHIRERGFDQIDLVARKLALPRRRVLGRAHNAVQVGATAQERKSQAEVAYRLVKKIHAEEHYILLDDIWTTGSTMRSALEVMKQAGAKRLSVVVIAKSVAG